MYRKLLLIVALGVMLSGCFMVPLVLVGPAVSGFSTASIAQSIVSHGANALLKHSTGKNMQEHALSSLMSQSGTVFKQSYFPEVRKTVSINPK